MSLFAEDIEYLERRLSKNPHSADKIKVADYYLKNGDAEEAIKLCKESLNDYPTYLTTFLILANAYISESDFNAAQETINKAEEYFPHHWAFHPIKKLIWQADTKGDTQSNEPFDEIHKSVNLAEKNEPSDYEIEDITDPITSLQKFSFNFDDYIKPHTSATDNLPASENDDTTLNLFRTTAKDFEFDNDDIVKSLFNDTEIDAIFKPKEAWNVVGGIRFSEEFKDILKEEGITFEEPTAPLPAPIKINSSDKIVLETELNQLLGDADLVSNDSATKDISNIDKSVQEEKPNSPSLVSKTMAEVYISQGKYMEAIYIYSELLKRKEITTDEYDLSMQALQEKMSPPEIDI